MAPIVHAGSFTTRREARLREQLAANSSKHVVSVRRTRGCSSSRNTTAGAFRPSLACDPNGPKKKALDPAP
jgi:hypothetical protein